MDDIEKMGKTEEAVCYIYKEKKGSEKVFLEKFGQRMFEEFKLTDMIRIGVRENRANIWSITKEGERMYRFVNIEKEYKPTIFERFQGWINGLVMDRSTFKKTEEYNKNC